MILTAQGIAKTPHNFAVAEQGLLEQTQADAVFWSGRAATSIYHAYQLAKMKRPDVETPEVIIPAMMCATAANTALLAGFIPRFADVGAETGLMSIETVKARFTENTVAVNVIHLLGHPVDIEPIAEFCKQHKLLLIEDPTQALGATYANGDFVGSVGDVTVYSFNRTKIISAGNGVLVSRNPDITTQLKTIIAETVYPQIDDNVRLQLGLSYRNLHHSLVGLLRLNDLPTEKISSAFMAVRSAFEPLFLRAVNPDIDLNSAWEALPETLAHRLNLANLYTERLAIHPAWHLLTDFQQSGVCWRFSLLLNNPDQQVAFSESIRQDGFHVSNLYWSPNQFFKPDDVCVGADNFSRRIVNLWVDSSVDEDYVKHCCDSLLTHAQSL